MAGPVQAEWEKFHGLVFAAGTPKFHHFGQGDIVYRLSEQSYSTGFDKTKRYSVTRLTTKTDGGVTTESFVDAAGTPVVLATVQGATQPISALTPFFYTITNVNTNEVVTGVHESDLRNEADTETYVGTQLAAYFS
jgi:hypothetical protein